MTPEELLGQTIADRFELRHILGRGGYGAVFDSVQSSIDRRCAVKVLLTTLMLDERARHRFKIEARATARLSNPHTLVIHDFGEDKERKILYLVMEYLEGRDLNTVLKQDGVFDVATTVQIIEQAASSLHNAHGQGIIHRDIKPHNIMLLDAAPGGGPFVKVIDFGISRVIEGDASKTMERLTATGTMVGTPHYMAPEQIRDSIVDGRTDQYALAICVYKMLTGRTPISGKKPIDVAVNQLKQTPLPLTAYNRDLKVSRVFEEVVLRALSKSIEDRYPDVLTFAQALRQASGRDVVAEHGREETTRPVRQLTALEIASTSDMDTPQVDTPETAPMAIPDTVAMEQSIKEVMPIHVSEPASTSLTSLAGQSGAKQRSTMLMFSDAIAAHSKAYEAAAHTTSMVTPQESIAPAPRVNMPARQVVDVEERLASRNPQPTPRLEVLGLSGSSETSYVSTHAHDSCQGPQQRSSVTDAKSVVITASVEPSKLEVLEDEEVTDLVKVLDDDGMLKKKIVVLCISILAFILVAVALIVMFAR